MKGDRLYRKAMKEVGSKKPKLSIVYELLNKAHEAGNFRASYAIATWYLFGKYVKKDYKKAVSLLNIAKEGDLSEAFFDLAVCYEIGKGVKKNKYQAYLNYLAAAIRGDKQAIFEVGRCYYYGIGVKKDIELAETWLNAAKHFGIQ